ncbi:MAG: hypothetical protein ACXABY_37730 [Candidatus Thorarchaeota archaeon]|jgi:hypothetical protein
MFKFRVGFNYHEAGFVTVMAKNEEHAEHIVMQSLENDGLDLIITNADYDTAHRDYSVDVVEEV